MSSPSPVSAVRGSLCRMVSESSYQSNGSSGDSALPSPTDTVVGKNCCPSECRVPVEFSRQGLSSEDGTEDVNIAALQPAALVTVPVELCQQEI